MTIAAIYRNGVFQPEQPVELPEGTRVEVLAPCQAGQEDISAEMKRRFPTTFGVLPPQDAAALTQMLDEAFGTVNPDEWS